MSRKAEIISLLIISTSAKHRTQFLKMNTNSSMSTVFSKLSEESVSQNRDHQLQLKMTIRKMSAPDPQITRSRKSPLIWKYFVKCLSTPTNSLALCSTSPATFSSQSRRLRENSLICMKGWAFSHRPRPTSNQDHLLRSDSTFTSLKSKY